LLKLEAGSCGDGSGVGPGDRRQRSSKPLWPELSPRRDSLAGTVFAAEPTPLSISTIVAHGAESLHPMKSGDMEEPPNEIAP
jgi:hypothetical protein